jgi:hypothetical protein
MSFPFLAERDSDRLSRVLAKFAACDFREFGITGSVAIALQTRDEGQITLNDLDLVVASANALPPTLGEAFLVRHFHPHAQRGRILIQLADARERLRIDVFTVIGASLQRAASFANGLAVLSKEDLAARLASILLGLDRGRPVERKYLSRFERVSASIDVSAMARVWLEHRGSDDPATYDEAVKRFRAAALAHPELLQDPIYATAVGPPCPDCAASSSFKCAPAERFLSVFGYC